MLKRDIYFVCDMSLTGRDKKLLLSSKKIGKIKKKNIRRNELWKIIS